MVNTRTAATKEDGSQEVAQLPNLVARQGIKQWHCDRDIFTIGEISAEERKKSIAKLPAITKTMRPPADGTIPLEFCLRIMPHDQDTGGFFVAVFEKFRSTGDLKGSKSTRFDRNSEELSVKAMKELGYNPKRLEIGKAENVSTMKTWNALHFNYDNFTDEDTIDKLGLRLNENYSAVRALYIVFSDCVTVYHFVFKCLLQIRCSKVDGFDSSHDGFSVISKR